MCITAYYMTYMSLWFRVYVLTWNINLKFSFGIFKYLAFYFYTH